MENTEARQKLRCDTILVTPQGIAETCGKKAVIFVPAAEIQSLTLKYGRPDHRPIFTVSLGVVFALIGVFGLVEFIIAPRGYRYELAMVAFGIIGGSLIHDALKQRYFIEVQSAKGPRRLVFSKHAQRNDLQTFCQNIRTTYKYDIPADASTACRWCD